MSLVNISGDVTPFSPVNDTFFVEKTKRVALTAIYHIKSIHRDMSRTFVFSAFGFRCTQPVGGHSNVMAAWIMLNSRRRRRRMAGRWRKKMSVASHAKTHATMSMML